MSDSVCVTANSLICCGLKTGHTYLFWERSNQDLREKGGIRKAVVVQILIYSLRQKTFHGLSTGSSPSTELAEQSHLRGFQRNLCTNEHFFGLSGTSFKFVNTCLQICTAAKPGYRPVDSWRADAEFELHNSYTTWKPAETFYFFVRAYDRKHTLFFTVVLIRGINLFCPRC